MQKQYFYNMISVSIPNKRIFIIICILAASFFSCRQIDVFEKNTPIPRSQWRSDFKGEGSFVISDTLAAYNIYIVLRHKDAYKYNNIWLNVGLESPGDSMFLQKLNLSLGSDANGWEGIGMNDIWEVRKLLNNEPRRFRKSGLYKYAISQIMRDDPLNGVMSTGLRLEKKN